MNKPVCIVLLIANIMVLSGMLWPEAAPPFAHAVNIATMLGNIAVFVLLMRRNQDPRG